MAKKPVDNAFSTFSKDDILREEEGTLYWKGNKLPESSIEMLKQESATLRDSLLWKILKAELEWFALKSLIEGGESVEDIRIARIFGNIVREIDLRIKKLAK